MFNGPRSSGHPMKYGYTIVNLKNYFKKMSITHLFNSSKFISRQKKMSQSRGGKREINISYMGEVTAFSNPILYF